MSSIAPSSPTVMSSGSDMDFDFDDSRAASTAVPSSPVFDTKLTLDDEKVHNSDLIPPATDVSQPTTITTMEHVIAQETLESRLKGLNKLLERSEMYIDVVGKNMRQTRLFTRSDEDISGSPREDAKTGEKRAMEDTEGGQSKRRKEDGDGTALSRLEQPENIVNVTLKPYQLLGVEWLTSLFLNNVNGILADEMGLGKASLTLQTIAFLAHVPDSRPALIVCPLSVLHSWTEEFNRFAPSIPVSLYHGKPDERAEIRRNWKLRENDHSMDSKQEPSKKQGRPKKAAPKEAPVTTKKRGRKAATKTTQSATRGNDLKGTTTPKDAPTRPSTRRSTRFAVQSKPQPEAVETEQASDTETEQASDAEEAADASMAVEDEAEDNTTASAIPQDSEEAENKKPSNDLVVVTTYEMIIKDAKFLSKYEWNFIIVDEGHRLKNMDCKLIKEIERYKSGNRLILTGTPLHNNLAELWSLLHFILPDLFSDLDSFQAWFDLPDMDSALPSEQSSRILSKLHAIMKPFLLRRLKADVIADLPPKKEYVLYAPLSERQRELYDAILDGALRNFLIAGKQGQAKKAIVDVNEGRKLRKKGIKHDDNRAPSTEVEAGRDYFYKNSIKQVNNLKLQNTIMQLRKVCSHPFLFDWPEDHEKFLIVSEELVNASGKMMILDRLLTELIARGHKVLIFSQFTTMLDIIEEWATSFKSWSTCRIDGQTKPDDRREEMRRFQTGRDDPDAPKIFLLSTRAGGLGITLTAADTVIFYDQDWNPQMDIQAQDRAHRIGQTKPVLIYRLVSAHTIETTIMKKANKKRQLEALVIAKGKFRMPGSSARAKDDSFAEATSLLKLEGEKIEVVSAAEAGKAKLISDADLDKLLDRRPEVFTGRGQGWTSGAKDGEETKNGDVAFEVFQAPNDQCNDSLAAIMGEEIPN
ncbi:hypothetical protein M422DRAFT_41263 [Sphaerobolus stellatus SS14]|nr:hypothetical protein M422DRAFT_41263 [Sphaerobolus stellatus SS14]